MEETPWPKRREGLIAALLLQASTTGIICLQEVLHGQLEDISSLLNKYSDSETTKNSGDIQNKWEYAGVGRDDGVTKGEYSPIFYNTEVHDLISWRCFWLSETPDRPGKGWDAASVRICTVGRFGYKGSGKHDFTIMVTPFPLLPIPSKIHCNGMLANLLFSPPTSTTRASNQDINPPSSSSKPSTLNFPPPHPRVPSSFAATSILPLATFPIAPYPLACTTCAPPPPPSMATTILSRDSRGRGGI